MVTIKWKIEFFITQTVYYNNLIQKSKIKAYTQRKYMQKISLFKKNITWRSTFNFIFLVSVSPLS